MEPTGQRKNGEWFFWDETGLDCGAYSSKEEEADWGNSVGWGCSGFRWLNDYS